MFEPARRKLPFLRKVAIFRAQYFITENLIWMPFFMFANFLTEKMCNSDSFCLNFAQIFLTGKQHANNNNNNNNDDDSNTTTTTATTTLLPQSSRRGITERDTNTLKTKRRSFGSKSYGTF
jgi:hypothetical protein